VFVYVFNNSFTFHIIQLSLSLYILAQVCVCCALGRPSNPITSRRGGGEPYIWWYCSQARAAHSSQRDEERSRAKVVGFVFSSFYDGCVVMLSFVRNHPSVMLLSVLSLSRVFSVVRFWHTHSLLFRRIYFKYTIEMYLMFYRYLKTMISSFCQVRYF
jgi:hypothetical protein